MNPASALAWHTAGFSDKTVAANRKCCIFAAENILYKRLPSGNNDFITGCFFVCLSIHENRFRRIVLSLQQQTQNNMPANKNAVTRYYYLDQLLANRYHNYSTEDLCRLVNEELVE
ncbi:MAG: hypothetical protein K6F96_01145, partial [Bacteroidales bacterium]|nr:hypothetical protein [Bacteroidales bacterium]